VSETGKGWVPVEDADLTGVFSGHVFERKEEHPSEGKIAALCQTISLGEGVFDGTARFHAAFQDEKRLAVIFKHENLKLDLRNFFTSRKQRHFLRAAIWNCWVASGVWLIC